MEALSEAMTTGRRPSASAAVMAAILPPTNEPETMITTGMPRGRSRVTTTLTNAAAKSGLVVVRLAARSPRVVVIAVYSDPIIPVRLGSISLPCISPCICRSATSTRLDASIARAALSISA